MIILSLSGNLLKFTVSWFPPEDLFISTNTCLDSYCQIQSILSWKFRLRFQNVVHNQGKSSLRRVLFQENRLKESSKESYRRLRVISVKAKFSGDKLVKLWKL